MKKNIIFCFFIIILISSCNLINYKAKYELNKYREKNKVNSLNLDTLNGNIEIIGWQKNFIEINSKKILSTGIVNDLNLMNLKFSLDNYEFFIKNNTPARVDGRIDLKIYIPFNLLNIKIKSNNGNIYLNEILSNIIIEKNTGSIDGEFFGQILRINSNNSKIDIDIKTDKSADIIINNEDGNSKINLYNLENRSFVDLISKNGNINLNTNKKIQHNLSIFSNNKNIYTNYLLDDKIIYNGNINYISGRVGDNEIYIDISNINGKIITQLLNE